jgi:hypothetical protein
MKLTHVFASTGRVEIDDARIPDSAFSLSYVGYVATYFAGCSVAEAAERIRNQTVLGNENDILFFFSLFSRLGAADLTPIPRPPPPLP